MSVWNKVVELQEALASCLRKPHNATRLGDVRSVVADKPSAHANQSTGREGSVRIPKWKSANLYASPEPFASMWQKLLKSSIVEAL
jgi:hypothetical protein